MSTRTRLCSSQPDCAAPDKTLYGRTPDFAYQVKCLVLRQAYSTKPDRLVPTKSRVPNDQNQGNEPNLTPVYRRNARKSNSYPVWQWRLLNWVIVIGRQQVENINDNSWFYHDGRKHLKMEEWLAGITDPQKTVICDFSVVKFSGDVNIRIPDMFDRNF